MPTFAASSAKNGEHVRHIKLDTEANPNNGQEFAIRSIPTLSGFMNGVLSPAQLERLLGSLL